MKKLSIIIPVYCNQMNLLPLYDDIKNNIFVRKDVLFEIIFVDDGSNDDSWGIIQKLSKSDNRIKGIKLSRNFGSHAAILCGLSNCSGDCAAIKAADSQEPTELIFNMLDEWSNGYNVVLAVREDREDKSFFSNLYYRITRKFALKNMPEHGFDVFLIDRKVIKVLETLDEKNSAITGQILWSGFKTKEVYYVRKKRLIGKSKWTLKKKIRLVMDTLFSFSTLPITFVTSIGAISIVVATIWFFVILISRMNNRIQVQGYTTLLAFQLLSFGIIMITLGLLGNYLWRTFDSSRRRPVYIIEDKINNDLIKEKFNEE